MNEIRKPGTVLQPHAAVWMVSPEAFRISAREYFKCRLDFQSPTSFSVVPFFLCCRAIELALKGDLRDRDKSYDELIRIRHNLVRAYQALPKEQQLLSADEFKILAKASEIYKAKDFEYFNIADAFSAYKRFPDLEQLTELARKITRYDEHEIGT